MQQFLSILKQYWGYDVFRPLQADIIESIAEGKDTLGLMPTGGGKSLTFQVPTLAMEGVCIVVTPLIALMKDQVDNLKKRNIPAAAIYTGLLRDEILLTLDNAVYGAYKFLYVSPERLSTAIFLEKIKSIKVCLIAVDESHCISQWGYDFRPSYLKIAEIREFLPGIPVLALTATATPEVVNDIQDQLHFGQKNVFRKSFSRSNLAYVVRVSENKDEQLLKILAAVSGTSVVYVRNRKKTKEVAEFLLKNGILAEYFHAGLSNEVKDQRQGRWKSGATRVIVSTNAFGMGIDKAEVRSVIHLDLPDTLEAYFQEAGRAGRDEKKAYAVLLYNSTDATKMKKRISDAFPDKDFIRKTYDSLCNYLQVGEGSGLDKVFPFDIADFCAKFGLPILMAYSALKLLQQAGYIELADEQESSSTVVFTVNKDELYNTKHTQEQERLIYVLLRSYTGLFTDPAYVNEDVLAKRLEWKRNDVYELLMELNKQGVLKYTPRKKTPFISFMMERINAAQLVLNKETYDERKDRFVSKANAVLAYAHEENICRSQQLLAYFGEKNSQPCGQCDVCLKKKETELTDEEFSSISSCITGLLRDKSFSLLELLKNVPHKQHKVEKVVSFLLENGQIVENELFRLELKNRLK